MAEITVTGDRIETVFDLLGHKENDITYLGWGLAQSDDLLSRFLELVAAPEADVDVDAATLDLQRYRKGGWPGEQRSTSLGKTSTTKLERYPPEMHVSICCWR